MLASLCASITFANTASAESSVWKVSKNSDVIYVSGTSLSGHP
ncbi:hypothetical protein Q4506_02495 [Colwellia sp. 4_MG-2023]|nr:MULTISPECIES: hypothetical protein [unclassified Colwellia]MDO6486198.1 hypothetical protein [Colwellia sp. 6_MG-2023]MDO6505848.1 hypothetical protein [Colwellia sp. 5_MG-2023]MDO6554529.1 hypothetical protein [Colwellia sp. 4_MG-2023]MDO6652270.1 hypothetical protein [Colwellia sp. 3_MG-2023]MDO6664561.1 hypothetical protein [Colwellia sp. 2_MG-2023]